jgi:hypothetical protein
MATPESRLQQAIQKRLSALGVFCFKIHGSALMPAGLPDLICCVDGLFLGIEVKLPQTKNNVSPKQHYQHDKIRAAGGVAVVCCSVEEAEAIVGVMRGGDAMRDE